MSGPAPLKPWEQCAGVNHYHSSSTPTTLDSLYNNMSSGPLASVPQGLTLPEDQRAPPPVPPRSNVANRSPYYNNYSSPYGSAFGGGLYGNSSYGGFGSYSGFGGMGYGYGTGYQMARYGDDTFATGGFAQQAELSSRSAFQSIESVVQAVGSVAMLLDSTFQALYNSFRAVVGVADHFSRMRTHLVKIFSGLAILRTLQWLVSRVLSILRLRKPSTDDLAGQRVDRLWAEAASQAGEEVTELIVAQMEGSNKSNWPVIVFFSVIFMGPWLLYKIMSSFSSDKGLNWMDGSGEHFLAVAEFDFVAQHQDELSVKRNTRLFIAPKENQPRMRGWLLASIDGKGSGLVPLNYIKILGKRNRALQTNQTISSSFQNNAAVVPSVSCRAVPSATYSNQTSPSVTCLYAPSSNRQLDKVSVVSENIASSDDSK